MPSLSTSAHDLILERFSAFQSGDFSYIYDSYHPDALFRKFFPDRNQYLLYAAEELARRFSLRDCRILGEEIRENESFVLFCQTIAEPECVQVSCEIAHCRRAMGRWLYLGGMKLEGTPETLAASSWEALLSTGDGIWI